MNQTATRHDFLALSHQQQEKYTAVLRCLREQNLSCRAEMVGKDFHLIIGPGYSSPKYWMDRFDVPETAPTGD